jgi:hypothetical protein
MSSPAPDPRAASTGAGGDYDHGAWLARRERLLADAEAAHALAQTQDQAHHGHDPGWHEVAVVLDRVCAALAREHDHAHAGHLAWRAHPEPGPQ